MTDKSTVNGPQEGGSPISPALAPVGLDVEGTSHLGLSKWLIADYDYFPCYNALNSVELKGQLENQSRQANYFVAKKLINFE